MFKQVVLMAHPIGSIYESTDPTSPAVLFGGTWEVMEAGRVLISAGTASTGTVYNAGDKGGEEAHKLTSEELARTSAKITFNSDSPVTISHTGSGVKVLNLSAFEWAENEGGGNVWATFGGDQPHNNMQPYEVVHRWKRTA